MRIAWIVLVALALGVAAWFVTGGARAGDVVDREAGATRPAAEPADPRAGGPAGAAAAGAGDAASGRTALGPDAPGVLAAWEAYWRAYEDIGCDPLVGRRLPTLLLEAGATPRRNDLVFYGGCAGDGRLAPLAENLFEVLVGARDHVLAGGRIEAAAYDGALAELRAWAARPDAALWYCIHVADGARS